MRILLRDHNGVLSDLKPHFELVKTIQDAEVVVLWQDILAFELCIARTAKRMGKPIVVIQHGAHGSEDYVPPLSNELLADKILVWGEYDRDQLLGVGIDPKRIEITGTTVFEKLKGRTPHKGTHILFSPEHWDHDIPENLELYNKLKKLCKKNKWELKVKTMERHDASRYKGHEVYSNREHPDHLDKCAEVLAWADVVVSISEITFELLAQALDIPVICCDITEPRMFLNNPKYLDLKKPYSNAVKVIKNLDVLEETIKGQLKNPEELEKERRDTVLLRGGIHIENPLEKMINAIKCLKR
jgi:hypothetical protein